MRVDETSRFVAAPPDAVFRAFAEPGAMERWLPPGDMTGTMLSFDFREGGSYRMRLAYPDGHRGRGKTTDDADEIEVRFVRIEDGRAIEQEITFDSDDPAFSGVMRMTWTFEPIGALTLVTVRADDVPPGVRPEDHRAGLNATLDQLARLVEAQEGGLEAGPARFYHGTKADLGPGDLLVAGHGSNYVSGWKAGWIYFSATLDAATWGAELADGEGRGRIYVVEPTGPFEDDPNLTDKRFPGNPTRSFRSREPLRITGEVAPWRGHAPEQVQAMREGLERLRHLGADAIED